MANNGMLFGPNFWRSVGVLSYIVGLVCYALSLSFKSLFGEWNPTKIVVYAILSLPIGIVVLFAGEGECSVSDGLMPKLKPYVEFVILMLTSLYSFFADQSMKGKPDILTVVSSGAFALTSLCLSQLIELGFQVGLFNFFLGCLTVLLMKIHFIFILVAAAFSFSLIFLRSCSESRKGRRPPDSEAPLLFRQTMVSNGSSDQHVEIGHDGANTATATQIEGSSEEIAEGNEGSASHGEGNGNEGEYGSVHENPNNLSGDQLVAHYESVMNKMTKAHELQVKALNEQIRTLETLRSRRRHVPWDLGGEALGGRRRRSSVKDPFGYGYYGKSVGMKTFY